MSTEHEKLLNRIRSRRYRLSHKEEYRAYMNKWNADHRERRKEISTKYERRIGKIPRELWIKQKIQNADPTQWRGCRWWRNIANKIKKRDGYQCNICLIRRGQGIRIVVHHIVPVKIREDHSESNLITLCNSCHFAIHRRKDGVLLSKFV